MMSSVFSGAQNSVPAQLQSSVKVRKETFSYARVQVTFPSCTFSEDGAAKEERVNQQRGMDWIYSSKELTKNDSFAGALEKDCSKQLAGEQKTLVEVDPRKIVELFEYMENIINGQATVVWGTQKNIDLWKTRQT